MTSGDERQQNFSVSIPIGAAVAGLILMMAAAAYLLMGQGSEGESEPASPRPGSSFARRMGLLGLVTMIENDATRKVVVAVLKAMARRA
jgi:hypothetical protein